MSGGKKRGERVTFFYRNNPDKPKQLAEELGKLQSWCDGESIDLQCAYLPFALELDDDRFAPLLGVEAGISAEAPFSIAQVATASIQIPLIDTRPALRELLQLGERLELNGDAHYNAEASRVCAAAIWQQMKR